MWEENFKSGFTVVSFLCFLPAGIQRGQEKIGFLS